MVVENYDKNGNKFNPNKICLDLNYIYVVIKKYINAGVKNF